MKKRLRKKYRVGEFQELCFEFSFEYKGDVDSPECEQMIRAFDKECLEPNGLVCSGLLQNTGCNIAVHAADPTQTSEAQRAAVKAWVEARPEIQLTRFGELEDAWYGDL
ncbi:MAG: YggL family protein [Akkermansia sp.]|nr:YggL family protein [Akkermansia sp.]